MYRKATTGDVFWTKPDVWSAECHKRRLFTGKCIVELTLDKLSRGEEVGSAWVFYVENRIKLRFTKKGYYSRMIKFARRPR